MNNDNVNNREGIKEITLKDFKEVFNYLLDNNRKLVSEGKYPIAVGLEAAAGVGKSSVMEQVANERGMTYVKLSLAELDEVGDLTGFPVKEFYVKKGDKGGWVQKEMLASCESRGYTLTARSRTSYAPPAWLPENNPNGCILNLDDFTRGNQSFQQAVMELINTGRYISWNLPENTTIALTSNPDNGKYTVTQLDEAQKTRYINFHVKFELDGWALWAERYGLDNRAINFALSYPEIFTRKNTIDENILNPRSFVTFCNAISGIKDWNSMKSLASINLIAKGCFNDDTGIMSTMFTNFVNLKLDKLVSPKEILFDKWSDLKVKLRKCLYDNEEYKPARAALLATRLLNSASIQFEEGKRTAPVESRLIELIDSDERFFNEDTLFHIIKTLVTNYRSRCNSLIANPKINSRLVQL